MENQMAYECSATCDLNSDVLYAISTYLVPSFTRETPLIIVQEARRQVLYPLLRVCRAFRAAYEPLLYHSVAVRYDDYWESSIETESGSWNGVQDWVQRTGSYRDKALWETLERRDEVRPWVRRMDLDWDDAVERQGEPMRLPERLSTFLQGFENLHDLTIRPGHDRYEEPKITSWPMRVLSNNIRRLDLGASITYVEFLLLFQIPLLNELCVSNVHSVNAQVVTTDRYIRPRESFVTNLKIAACLSEAQILQMLQQPKRINVLVLTITSCALDRNGPPPRPQVLEDALLPFQDHIAVLEVTFEDQENARWQSVLVEADAEKSTLVEYRQFERLVTFKSLTSLKIPSFCLFGPIGNQYTRYHLAQQLPSSLKTLRVEFGCYDPIFQCTNQRCVGSPRHGVVLEPSDYESYAWISHFGRMASLHLPHLRGVIFNDMGDSALDYSIDWMAFRCWGDSLRQIKDNFLAPFKGSGIELGLVAQSGRKGRCWLCQRAYVPGYSDYDGDGDQGYWYDLQWGADAWLDGGWDPLFDDDPTEYSDSLRGSVAENLDNMMHAKREEAAAEQFYRHLEQREQGIVPSATNSEVSSIPSDDWY